MAKAKVLNVKTLIFYLWLNCTGGGGGGGERYVLPSGVPVFVSVENLMFGQSLYVVLSTQNTRPPVFVSVENLMFALSLYVVLSTQNIRPSDFHS